MRLAAAQPFNTSAAQPIGMGVRTAAPRMNILSAMVGAIGSAFLLQLNLLIVFVATGAAWAGGLKRPEHRVAFDGHAVGVLDGAKAGGYLGLAGGDGLAVAVTVGAFGEGLAVALDFTDVGFAFVGVGGDGEHDGVRRGGIEDKGDGLGFGVATG